MQLTINKFLTALLVYCCTAASALAQTAITLPIAANAIADLGNGPIKARMIAGNASIFTSQGSGVGSTSGSSTALTLTGTPATPPIVGGLISGAGITSGTTIAAYNGTTGVSLSAAMTVPGGTALVWGAACPSSAGSAPVIQASAQAGYYVMYTQARVCAVSPGGPVNTLLIEPIFYDQTTPNGGGGGGGAVASVSNSDGTLTITPTTGAIVASIALGHANVWTATQTFPNNSLTLAEFSTIGANTVIGSVAGGTPVALTRAQQTAMLNLATAALQGALPAWPNNTTTFFRGDGTYAALPAAPVYNIKLAPYNASCNYNSVTDGAMGSGSTTLTSVTANFAVGDVGKYIAVGGAGAAGANLFTTIATFVNSTTVTLTSGNASGGSISGKTVEYGNDDTAAFQAAVNASVAAGGGSTGAAPIYVPGVSCLVSRLNLTNLNGLRIVGEGSDSSRVFPMQVASYGTANGHMFDLTGSSFVVLESFQIGAFYELAAPTTAVMMAQVASGTSNRNGMNHMYISGQFTGCTFYDYGVPSLYTIQDNDFYNYSPGAGAHDVACLTATNLFSYTSSFATVTSGTKSTSDIAFLQTEFHKFAGAGADNFVVLLDSVANISFFSGVISGGATAYVDLVGANGTLSFHNVTMETESQPVTPTNGYNIAAAATFSWLDDPGTTYIISGGTFSSAPTSTTSVHFSH